MTRTAAHVCVGCISADPTINRFIIGNTTYTAPCSRCMKREASWLVDTAIDEPRVVHYGITTLCTTSAELVPFPVLRWDVNGYYKALGLTPEATRAEIRNAYLERLLAGLRGAEAERLTYIAKQLLDPEIRAEYDSAQPGDLFMDRFLMRAAVEREQAQLAAARSRGEVDEAEDADDMVTPEEVPDRPFLSRGGPVLDRRPREGEAAVPQEPWGFYGWASRCIDVERLNRWRSLLVTEFWHRGEIIELAVGFSKGQTPITVKDVDGAMVFFIDEDQEPHPIVAHEAAVLHLGVVTPLQYSSI